MLIYVNTYFYFHDVQKEQAPRLTAGGTWRADARI